MGENTGKEENVTSNNQVGGITAHTVTVGGAQPHKVDKKRPWWMSGWAQSVTLLAAAVTVLAFFHDFLKEKPVADDKRINVTSINQSGGITAHTVVVGPAQRSMSGPGSDALRAQILRDLPRTKPITVMALMGDNESYRFAAEIHAFLKANGFKLAEDGISQGVLNPPPRGLSINDHGDRMDFIVGTAN
ncbi:MAG: hypothetical protein JWN63_1268 [Candidatus Acidoferrum typicum]|nr:hypothetical protein [Candidatus Acidoferrum typicum]